MSKVKYVPILKWKRGERIALRNLTDDIKNLIRPMFLVINSEPDSYCAEVARNWGANREFYLDFHPDFSGNHAEFLEAVINDDESNRLSIIPVITMNSSSEFISLIENNLNDKFRNGLSLRIRSLDSRIIQEWLNSIDRLISNSDNIDLILDTGEIGHLPNDSIEMFGNLIKAVIHDLRQQNSFRHIIVAGSSFPRTINVRQNDISLLNRIEWLLWQNINDEMPYVLFGDYGVDDPQDFRYDRGITIVPTIRYTHEDYWYIVRGIHDPRAPRDYTQYHELARRLTQQSHIYCGADFSWGDARIYDIANTTCTITNCNHGNPESWVQIGTNHHLTYVAQQVNQAVVS